MLKRWSDRPVDEANLFNPAFIGGLLGDFSREYSKQKLSDTPFTLSVLGLSVSLHGRTRRRLPATTLPSLYEWLQKNEDVLIGIGDRTESLRPYLFQGLIFACHKGAMGHSSGHCFEANGGRAIFSPKFLREQTPEFNEIVKQTKFCARWFAKSGSEASILAAWGIRP